MLRVDRCPVCQSKIPDNRTLGGIIICQCGWTASQKAKIHEKKIADRSCITLVSICILLVSIFIQAANWDKYFFTIIPLKTKQLLGMSNQSDLNAIIRICAERKKQQCTEEAMKQSFDKSKDLKTLGLLGQMQYQRKAFDKAVATLGLYFKAGGKQPEVAFDYARTLGSLGQTREAIRYYKYALNTKQELLRISITRSYAELLIQANLLREAKTVIKAFRKVGASSSMFMESELKEIEDRLNRKVARN